MKKEKSLEDEINDILLGLDMDDYASKIYVDSSSNGAIYRTVDEILDELPIEDIENYLRRKKLQKLKSKM